MLAAAIVSALMLQQAATGQVVWSTPLPPEARAAPVPPPSLPDWARADPYGYERSECSPLIRKADETMDACQSRVRFALAANLGADLPAGLAPAANAENCRQEAAGDRYGLQCGAPGRPSMATATPQERVCESRPQAQARGGVAWTEECRPATGQRPNEDGLRIRIGGRD